MTEKNSSIEDLTGIQSLKIATNEAAEQFSDKMREIGLKEKEREAATRAPLMGVQYINLAGFPISPESLVVMPQAEAEKLKAVCFFLGADSLRIGSLDPKNPELLSLVAELEKKFHAQTNIYLISQHSFDFALKLYDAVPKIRKFVSGVEITKEEINRFEKEIKTFRDLNDKLSEVSVTDMLTLIISASACRSPRL